jgi:peptide/nickel transport system substrate-binding protein
LTGTGPFKFKENLPKDHVTLVRNADYNWPPACVDHKGPAYLNSITFKWVTEASVRGGILKTGEAQIADLPAQFAADYEKDAKYTVLKAFQPGTGLMWNINTAKAPLNDINVRKAIQHAVDRPTINKLLYADRYLVSYGVMIPGTMCYWKPMDTLYPYDPAKANALLEQAGWKKNASTGIREKDGKPLQIRWTAIHHGEMAEAVKAQFKEVGIDLKPEVVPATVQVEMVTQRNFDLMYYRLRNVVPVFLDLMFHSKNAKPGGYAMTGYTDPKLDAALEKAMSSTDPKVQCESFQAAQQIIMENALVLGMLGQPRLWAMDKSVKGFQLGPSGWMWYPYTVRIEK